MCAWPLAERLGAALRRPGRAAALIGVAWLLLAPIAPALAHKASDAYLFIQADAHGSRVRWDIALRDLDAVLPLDADGDRALTWGELQAAWPQVQAHALAALDVPGCTLALAGRGLERRSDGTYAVLHLATACRLTAATPLHYRLFAEVDPLHRAIVRYGDAGTAAAVDPSAAQTQVRVLVPQTGPAPADAPRVVNGADGSRATIDTGPPGGGAPPDARLGFVREGVHHILTGYDHLLFLLCLLLPAVLRRDGTRWVAQDSARAALLPVAGTVTLFTLAHSLTLAASALGWLRAPPSLVEPAIAATIAFAALDNLRPLAGRWRGALTFGFGLVHGLGFAGVLGELDLPPATFAAALLQFNIGLEAGQCAVLLVAVPALYLLRRRPAYVPAMLRGGSGAAIALAVVWFVERTFDVALLPS